MSSWTEMVNLARLEKEVEKQRAEASDKKQRVGEK